MASGSRTEPSSDYPSIRLAIVDAARFVEDVDDLVEALCQIVGSRLGVSRVGYAHIEGNRFRSRPGYTDGIGDGDTDGVLSDYGAAFVRQYKQGEAIVVTDIDTDDRLTPAERDNLRSANVMAFCSVAMTRARVLEGVFYAQSTGPRVWKDAEIEILRDAAEKIWQAVERDRIAAALDDSEARLRLAQEVAGVGTFDWDIVADINRWSPEIERLYGIPEGSFGGTLADWANLVHPEDLAGAQKIVVETLESGSESFVAEWRAKRAGGETFWLLARALVQRSVDGTPLRMIGANFDITAAKEKEERLKMLTAELDHRVKNVLAVVQSLARQTLSNDTSGAREAFLGRLQALALSHSLLSDRRWEGACLTRLFAETVTPFCLTDERCRWEGPDLLISPKMAQSLSLLFNELMTNSMKYGALSSDSGSVVCEGRVEGDGPAVLHMSWQERGGPAIDAPPTREGFGSRLIMLVVRSDLRGEARLDYRREGLVGTFAVPLTEAVPQPV